MAHNQISDLRFADLEAFMWVFKLFFLPFRLLLKPFGPALRFAVRFLRLRFFVGESASQRRKAQQYATAMLAEFKRLGFSKRIGTGKKKKRQNVRFEYPLLLTTDELWCPLDLRRLPTGVRTDDIRAEDVLRSLEDRLHAPIRVDYLANNKLCIVVGTRGVKFPEKISINAFQLDPDAPPLALPLGVTGDGQHATADLADLKHLIIAGATGGGKTTLQHAIINTLISRNSVEDLELWLIDLKGNEFTLYKSLMPRKSQPGIVRHIATEPEDAVQVLDAAYKEIRRRNTLMESFGATSLTDLAQLTGQRLKRIVLIFDEISIMTLDTTKIGKQSIGSWGTFLLAKIAALGRSSGVSIIIGTQQIRKEVLSGIIQANFENRICFSTADWRQSQMVIESSEAVGLPPGRAFARFNGRRAEYQTCFISPKQIRLEIARIAEFGPDGGLGDNEELARFVKDAKLLLATSCDQFSGDFARSKLLQHPGIKGYITQERFAEIAQRLERDGALEAGGPRKPRKVSRAFYGRAALLDSLYGLKEPLNSSNNEQTVDSDDDLQLAEPAAETAQQDAANDAMQSDDATVYGLEKEFIHAPVDDDSNMPEIELEDFLQRAIDQATQAVELAQKSGAKKRKKSKE